MRKNRVLIVLLTAVLVTPLIASAAQTGTASGETSGMVKPAPQVLVRADRLDAGNVDNDDDEQHDATNDDAGTAKNDKDENDEKKALLEKARHARDAARNERHRDRNELRINRDQDRDARHVDRQNETQNLEQRLKQAETDDERKALVQKMKAARIERRKQIGDERDEQRQRIRDREEAQRVVPQRQRTTQEQIRAEYAERLKSAEGADEGPTTQEEMPAASAEEQSGQAEMQESKKPWWKFWGK